MEKSVKSMKCRNWILFSALILLSPLSVFGTDTNLPELCVGAISRVKSYDAQITVEMLIYSPSNTPGKKAPPEVEFTMTNRDVFAVGFGRRVETFIGMESQHNVGVIDWKTAVDLEQKEVNSKPFLTAKPGYTYHDYFNPEAGVNGGETGVFLADLLTDKKSEIHTLENIQAGERYPGFELNHPGLNGPIRIWVDSAHGQMPAKIEWFARRSGQTSLTTKLEVEKFIEVEKGTWVPGTATLTSFVPWGPAKGQAIFGFSMNVAAEHSRWNCIDSGQLFTAQSVPEMNHQEKGWRFHYPPAVLAAIEASDRSESHALKKLTHQSIGIRLALVILLFSPLLWAGGKWVFSRRKLVPH
jgi:hypothetical protein